MNSNTDEALTLLVIIIFVAVGLVALISASDTHNVARDERGCQISEHYDNRIGPGNVTRTVETLCPVEDK